MTEYQISGVTFTPEGMAMEFTTNEDVRVGGYLMRQRALHLHSGHPDYREDIEHLQSQLVRILKNALEDFEDSDPWVPDEETEDDEKGMGE